EPDALALLCSLLWFGASCAGVEGFARQLLSLSQRYAAEHDPPPAWSGRGMFGRGTGRPYPPADSSVPPSWRGLPQVMGTVALLWRSREPPPCATGDARERLGRAALRWTYPCYGAGLHDGPIITDKVNEMWGTDMTQTITIGEGRAYVFVAVEHANSEVIGIHAARSANRFEALEPVRQGVHRCFGAIAPGVACGLKLRHDHGSNYMSGDFQNEIACLGIEASPSFVREPEGNGVAERFIRTLKENLLWVRTFDTIEELRAALVEFAWHYNETWLVARHGYRNPA